MNLNSLPMIRMRTKQCLSYASKILATSFVLIIGSSVIAPSVAYDGKTPDAIVKETTEAFLADVEKNKAVYQADNEKLYAMVKELVEKNLDTQRIGRLVLGKHWRKANEDQRQRFLDAFRNLMMKTYATAIFEYEGQPISYRPLKMKDGAKDVVVRTDIDTGQGRKVAVNYSMGLDDGTWKIFDVNVAGVSLVTSYRASYTREVKRRGIDGLIAALEKKAAQRN